MNRLWLILLVPICFSDASGQEQELSNIALFALAYDPIEIQDIDGRLLVEPRVEEYVLLKELDYSEGTPLEFLDVVAIIANPADGAATATVATLQRSRRITEFDNAGSASPTGDWSSWEVVQEKGVGLVQGQEHVKVVFERIDVNALWLDLWQSLRWPSEVRFRVSMRCRACSASEGPAISTIRLVPKD